MAHDLYDFSIGGNTYREVKISFGMQASGTPVARYYEVDFPEVISESCHDVVDPAQGL